jgi:hypothetical protein
MTSSFAHPSNLHVEDLGDKLCIAVNLAKVNRVSSDTTKLSITAYYNDDCTVDQEFVSQAAIKDAIANNDTKFVTFYKPKCRPANITLMVMESLVDGSEVELGQATIHAICYPDAPVLSIVSAGVSKLDDVDSHKVKTSGVKLRVNLSNDGGFQFRSVNFFVNKKDNSNSPIVKLPPIMLSEDDVAAGFAVVTLPDVVTVADRKISINASVDNVAGLESNVSSVSVLVSNAIRPHAVEMVSAESCRESAVPVCVKVGVNDDAAYVSVLARAEHDECWSTTNVLNVPATEISGSLSAVVTGLGEMGDELLPFVTYHFAAVQHGSLKCASDDVCTLTSMMPDQSKVSNAVSAVPFADFRFSCELSLASAGALSLDSAGALHVAPSLAVSNMKSDEDFCSVWKFKQNGAVLDSVNSCDHAPPAFQLNAFEYTDGLELCVDFYKMVPGEVAESVHCDAVLDMEAVNGRPGRCLHVSGATLAFRPPPSSKAIPVPHALKLEFYNKALFVHHEDPVNLMKQQQLAIQSIEYQVSSSAEFGEDSLQFLSDDKKTSVVVAADGKAGIAGDAQAGIAGDAQAGIAEKSKHLLLYSGDGHVKSLASEDSFYVRARYTVSFLNNIVLQSEWNEPAHSGMVNKCIKVTSITLKQTPPSDFNSLTTSFLSLIVEASVDVGHQMVQDVSVFVLIKHGANSHKAELLYDAASNVWRSAVLSPTPKVDYSAQPVHVCAVGPLNMDVKTL